MSCLIWAVVIIVLGVLVFCYMKKKSQIKKEMADADHKHELDMKDQSFVQEKYWYEEGNKAKQEELERKIREYKELTIHQKILDKVINRKTDEEISDLKKALEELKNKYESLDGEIEQIIIKNKQ
jgi:predicted Holliday junction resolvase-like endonuclease